MRHEQGCGQRPRAVSGGIQYSHCSRTCAQKYATTIPTVCAMVGCADTIDPAFGRFCPAAHAGYVFSFTHFYLASSHDVDYSGSGFILCSDWPRPRHKSLDHPTANMGTDPRLVQASIPPNHLRASQARSSGRRRILFYHKHDPHYGFTNFSYHPVVYRAKTYPTSKHLFQSFKVCECSCKDVLKSDKKNYSFSNSLSVLET